MRIAGFLVLTMLAVVPALSAQTIDVSTRGAVSHPGTAAYPATARLSDVTDASGVSPDAYTLGAAWLQPALHTDQVRLKAGVLFELGAIHRKAMAEGDDELALRSAAFQSWLSALPVTDRRAGSALDPARLAISPADDRPVHAGDTLVFPPRPADVRIVGAVTQACRVPQVPMRDARRYLADCPVSRAADRDAIYVIQPDGAVFEQEIALWNRDDPRPLAPGAWIYVPFDRRKIAGAAEDDFNRDVADFIATQLLDGDGWR